MNKLTLFIDAQKVPFISAFLSFSLEQLAHTFNASIPYVEIDEPLPVEFKLNNKSIFTGQIDTAGEDISGEGENTTITGRSLSANLIDSRIKTDATYNQTFEQILKSIVSEYGLGVLNNVPATTPLPLIPEFQINAESPVANLAQIAKQQNLMLIERNGVIVIEKPGQFIEKNIQLKLGVNCETISIKKNFAGRFNTYEIQSAYDNNAEATATDSAIIACRKKVIIADKLQDAASCKTRAEYEKNIAIAKGLNASASLPDIFPELTGDTLNKTISVEKKTFKENLLIKSINISAESSSQSTSLELFRPFGE